MEEEIETLKEISTLSTKLAKHIYMSALSFMEDEKLAVEYYQPLIMSSLEITVAIIIKSDPTDFDIQIQEFLSGIRLAYSKISEELELSMD